MRSLLEWIWSTVIVTFVILVILVIASALIFGGADVDRGSVIFIGVVVAIGMGVDLLGRSEPLTLEEHREKIRRDIADSTPNPQIWKLSQQMEAREKADAERRKQARRLRESSREANSTRSAQDVCVRGCRPDDI